MCRAADPIGFADKAIGPSRRRQPVAEQKFFKHNHFSYSPYPDEVRMCGE